MTERKHKSGFVNIIGNPNVGKSTLMNRLVGERISIITSKAQTTRHRILGIVNTDDMQIVYSDTPGVLRPNYKLQETMRESSESALGDADILLYVTDMVEKTDKNDDFLQQVRGIECPVLLLINKIDLTDQAELTQAVEAWHTLLPAAEIIPISALSGFNVEPVKRRIEALLPDSPPYFEKDALTDRPARFFVTEIIREKILLYYQKEIPYATEVVVEEFIEARSRYTFARSSSWNATRRRASSSVTVGRRSRRSARRRGVTWSDSSRKKSSSSSTLRSSRTGAIATTSSGDSDTNWISCRCKKRVTSAGYLSLAGGQHPPEDKYPAFFC